MGMQSVSSVIFNERKSVVSYGMFLRRLINSATCLGLFLGAGLADGAEPARLRTAKPARTSSRRAERIEVRLKNKRNAVDTASTAGKGESSSTSRFQMQRAGQRVVILDTQTGETKIIEPEARTPYQNVEVGKAWVVVTVLGNVSERPLTSNK